MLEKISLKRFALISISIAFLILTIYAANAIPSLDVFIDDNITAYVGEDTFVNLSLKNVGNQTVYNISFSDIQSVYWPGFPSIVPNQTVSFPVRISPVSVYSDNFVFTTAFLYVIGDVYEPVTYDVEFNTNSFSPSNIVISKGDSLNFINLNSSDATIKEFNDSFVIDVGGGGSSVFQFVDLGNFKLYHVGHGFVLNVLVEDAFEGVLAHSNDFDVSTNLFINAVWMPGDVVLNNVLRSFMISFDGEAEGILEVRNQGDGVAKNIHLSADWVRFDENDFDIDSGSSKLVRYFVSPDSIFSTGDTNKSYEHVIIADVENGDDVNTSFNVFIAYHNFEEVRVGNVTYTIIKLSVNETIAFCKSNPFFEDCTDLFVEKPVEIVIVKNSTHELSEEDLKNIVDSASSVGGVAQRIENKNNIIGQDINEIRNYLYRIDKDFSNVSLMLTNRVVALETTKKKSVIWAWVKWVVSILSLFVLASFFIYKKYKHGFRRFEMFHG